MTMSASRAESPGHRRCPGRRRLAGRCPSRCARGWPTPRPPRWAAWRRPTCRTCCGGIAGFTPAKRAKLGGPALLAELAGSAAFRAAVMAWWDEHRPGELVADRGGRPPHDRGRAPCSPATRDAADAVAATARRVEVGEVKAERDTLLSEGRQAHRRDGAAARRADRGPGPGPGGGPAARGRVPPAAQAPVRAGRHPARPRSTRRAAAEEQMAALRAEHRRPARRGRGRVRAGARPGRGRAQAGRPAPPRRSPRPARPPARPVRPTRPASRCWSTRSAARWRGCAASSPSAAAARAPRTSWRARRRRGRAPGSTPCPALDALLAVPTLHLVVDGYNVSKTGYPELHAGRPAQPADHPARRARRPHPGGDHRGVRRRGRDGRAAPRRARACGCCSASRACSPTTSSVRSSPPSRTDARSRSSPPTGPSSTPSGRTGPTRCPRPVLVTRLARP